MAVLLLVVVVVVVVVLFGACRGLAPKNCGNQRPEILDLLR